MKTDSTKAIFLESLNERITGNSNLVITDLLRQSIVNDLRISYATFDSLLNECIRDGYIVELGKDSSRPLLYHKVAGADIERIVSITERGNSLIQNPLKGDNFRYIGPTIKVNSHQIDKSPNYQNEKKITLRNLLDQTKATRSMDSNAQETWRARIERVIGKLYGEKSTESRQIKEAMEQNFIVSLGQSQAETDKYFNKLDRERFDRIESLLEDFVSELGISNEPTEQGNKKMIIEDNRNEVMQVYPIFHGRDFSIESDLCFILMPFREPFDRIYRTHIVPVVNSVGLKPLRADGIFTPTSIIEDIWEHLNKAKVIIADVTGKNPNVFYELGIAHTIGKDVIIITQSNDDVPFDVGYRRYFPYTDNQQGWNNLKQNLENALRSTLNKQLK